MGGADPKRLVAVFGFSARGVDGLHPLCLLRLRHAEAARRRSRRGRPVGLVEARHGVRGGRAHARRLARRRRAAGLRHDRPEHDAERGRHSGASRGISESTRWSSSPRRGMRPEPRALVRAALGDADVVVSTSSPRGPHAPVAPGARARLPGRTAVSAPPRPPVSHRSLTALAAGRLSRERYAHAHAWAATRRRHGAFRRAAARDPGPDRRSTPVRRGRRAPVRPDDAASRADRVQQRAARRQDARLLRARLQGARRERPVDARGRPSRSRPARCGRSASARRSSRPTFRSRSATACARTGSS